MSEPIGTPPATSPTGAEEKRDSTAAGRDRSSNAVRVERHKRKLAANGLRQLNVQVPVSSHGLLKVLAQRLRDGEDPNLVLFDLVAEQSIPAFDAELPPRIDPKPPLHRGELKSPPVEPNGTTDRAEADAHIVRRIREVLDRGGWRAALIRGLLD